MRKFLQSVGAYETAETLPKHTNPTQFLTQEQCQQKICDPFQCGGEIGPNDIISATEIYADLVSKYPHAKLIGPNTTFNIKYGGEITGFLDAWLNQIDAMELPRPYGYAIHLYPSPTINESAEEWTQAYCNFLEAQGELELGKELWVTELGWSNDWVLGANDATRQAYINTLITEEFGFFETGLETNLGHNCQITRYAWFTNRIRIGLTVTPDLTPESPVGYTDLYWYWSLTRSYTGNAYVDFGNLSTPTPTP